jgi:hypothetical protein
MCAISPKSLSSNLNFNSNFKNEIQRIRASWGVFRDRRPEHYTSIGTLDGGSRGFEGLSVTMTEELRTERSSIPPKNYHMPAEWSHQSAVWMAWPYRREIWSHECIPGR